MISATILASSHPLLFVRERERSSSRDEDVEAASLFQPSKAT